jgi:tripartite motif-containing protein 45
LNEGNDLETLVFVSTLLKKFQKCRKNENSMDIKITESLQFLSEVKAPSNSAQNNIPLYGIITTQTPSARNCLLEKTQGLSNLRVNKKAELILLTRDTDER